MKTQSFWQTRRAWPSDLSDSIFLGNAVDAVGISLHSAKWRLSDMAETSDSADDVRRWFIERAASGKLRMSYLARGELRSISPGKLAVADGMGIFECCNWEWSSIIQLGSPLCPIYVDRNDFYSGLPTDAQTATDKKGNCEKFCGSKNDGKPKHASLTELPGDMDGSDIAPASDTEWWRGKVDVLIADASALIEASPAITKVALLSALQPKWPDLKMNFLRTRVFAPARIKAGKPAKGTPGKRPSNSAG